MLIRILGLFLKYILIKHKYRKTVKFNGFTVFYAFKDSSIELGKDIVINSHPLSNLVGLTQRMIIIARYGGKIKIGDGCGFSGSTIYAMDSIIIGNDVLLGGNCKIIDNDFHPLNYTDRKPTENKNVIKKFPIVIGDGCFIGANSIILKGTTLGKNVVVGAGSVVSGTFPDNVIIAGNPAKIVKENKE